MAIVANLPIIGKAMPIKPLFFLSCFAGEVFVYILLTCLLPGPPACRCSGSSCLQVGNG